jgi:hypothetical protein
LGWNSLKAAGSSNSADSLPIHFLTQTIAASDKGLLKTLSAGLGR